MTKSSDRDFVNLGVALTRESKCRLTHVGCGHGASTLLMAKALPRSEFVGIDYHEPSIETARRRAADAGVRNARFEAAGATSYGERDLDFVAFFDCLHDMADLAGAASTEGVCVNPGC